MDFQANLERFADLRRESAARMFEFLHTDADTALTFATLALQANDDPQKRDRNRINARTGFDTIMRFKAAMQQFSEHDPAARQLEEKLAALKAKLEMLGEKFD